MLRWGVLRGHIGVVLAAIGLACVGLVVAADLLVDDGASARSNRPNRSESPPAGTPLAEVIAYYRAQPEPPLGAGTGLLPGEAAQRPCGDLPAPSSLIAAMRPQNCWWLFFSHSGYDWFLGGNLPDDRSTGALFINLPHDRNFSEIVPLPDGAVEPLIHAVTAEAVCFTTADGEHRAYDLEGHRLVPVEQAPSCPSPPRYTPGDVEVVACRELPVYLNDLESAGAKDCRKFAVDERRRGYVWFANSAEASYLVVLWPPVGQSVGWEETLEVSATLRITGVGLDLTCFVTDAGPGAFDMTERVLVDGPIDGCPIG